MSPGAADGSAPVVIDARAAARIEIGGVERVAIEMSARLPRLAPGRYRVIRPPPARPYKAGHRGAPAARAIAARSARGI